MSSGKSGSVSTDFNADRVSNYAVWHLPMQGSEYETLIEINMESEDKRIDMKSIRNWGPSGTVPPIDEPECGFVNELCPSNKSGILHQYSFAEMTIFLLESGL